MYTSDTPNEEVDFYQNDQFISKNYKNVEKVVYYFKEKPQQE